MPDELTPRERSMRIAVAFEAYVNALPTVMSRFILTPEEIAAREERAEGIHDQLHELLEGSADA